MAVGPETVAAQLLDLQDQLARSQRWSPEQMLEYQLRQLRLLTEHAHGTRPFYRARLEACGYRPGQEITLEFWRTLPILSRREVQDNFAAITDGPIPAAHLPYSWDSTSGSSGMPLKIKKTRLERLMWLAATLREELWHRRDVSAKLAVIRRAAANDAFPPEGKRMADWGPPVALVYHTGPAVLLDNRSSTEQQAAWLLREQPGYLLSFPSIIRELARYFRSEGLRLPSIRCMRTFGETVGPDVAPLCREVFGVEVVDVYSASEIGYLALQCPEHARYHVQSEMMLVEVLDEAGRACAPGEVGSVVVTPFHNFAMPLLRYAIGDLAEVGAPCACGRTLPVLARILGKARDLVVLPSGARRFVNLYPNTIADLADLVQIQVAQKSLYDLEVRLVTRGVFGAANEEKLRRLLNENLGAHFRIAFDYRDAIARSPGGKYFDFVCEIPDR